MGIKSQLTKMVGRLPIIRNFVNICGGIFDLIYLPI